MSLIELRVNNESAIDFCKDFTGMDVKEALDQMFQGKSPGLDGMTVVFYKSHWDIIGGEIT